MSKEELKKTLKMIMLDCLINQIETLEEYIIFKKKQ